MSVDPWDVDPSELDALLDKPALEQAELSVPEQPATRTRASHFLAFREKLTAAAPFVPREGLGDGLCENPNCVSGKIVNLQSGQDTDCPVCLRNARIAQLEKDFDACNIPLSELHTEWADVNQAHDSWQKVRRYCQQIKACRARGYNAVLVGLPGRGKSLSGALICRAAVEAQMSARMITAYDLVSRVKATFSADSGETEAKVMEVFAGFDFLVIDDLGAAQSKANIFEVRILTALIDAREKAKRPTVITSNLTSSEELEAAMGFRALERIRYKAAQVLFDGPNERERKHRAEVADLDLLIMGDTPDGS